MRTKLLLTSIAALFLATGAAVAQQPGWLPSAQYQQPIFDKSMLPKPPSQFPLLPPAKYDRPYVGRLTLEITTDLPSRCPATTTIACARREQFSCSIIMIPDETIIRRGLDPLVVFRHEQGHCNGWMGDHRDSDPEW